jgi:PHD/YefM family antitoxin component YafN of YafNO toxin-antitoxin module
MPKFLIERTMPGAGQFTPEELEGAAQVIRQALAGMGPDIQWLHSYVTGDRFYCVYLAPDEAAVREHARYAGFPVDRIVVVTAVIDPATAEGDYLRQLKERVMRRIKVKDIVQDVEQALAAVRADEVTVIEQEDSDNLVLITQQHFQRLMDGQRNPNAAEEKVMAGQRNPDAAGEDLEGGQRNPDAAGRPTSD